MARSGKAQKPAPQQSPPEVVAEVSSAKRQRPGVRLTQQQRETHLWGAANILRGKTVGQDYKNYILSLMFYKRLCDQCENEADEAIAEQERQQGRAFTEKQKAVFRARGEYRFNIPEGSRWGDVLAVSANIGEKLTEAAAPDRRPHPVGVRNCRRFLAGLCMPAPAGDFASRA